MDKLDELDKTQLQLELKKSREELFNLRFQKGTGQLHNNSRIREVKRDIARIYTVMHERELGIRIGPDSEKEN